MEQARCDLSDAEYMAEGRRFNNACFLAQQSAEKALKAYLYGRGEEAARRNSVADLCEDAA